MRLDQWIRMRAPECAIFLVGVLLRLTMAVGWRYQAEWGYDAAAHWSYVQWIAQNLSLPSISENYVAYHPPLYHLAAAALVKLGVAYQSLTWLSFGCGVIRLALIWCGLEWYLQSRRARISGLALAALLPTSILIDGMITNESMNGMFCAGAMLLWPRAFRTTGKRRWRLACVLGLVFGFGALAKLSGLVLFGVFGVGAMLDLLLPPEQRDWKTRGKALAPWAATAAICLGISGWFYARSIPQYRNPFITSYEVSPEKMAHRAIHTPYLDRRTLGFVFGWDPFIFRRPYYPTGLEPTPRFFSVILASTFVDYYNYSFSGLGPGPPVEGDLLANSRPVTKRLLRLSRGAVIGGSIIALGTIIAWLVYTRKSFRQKDWGLFSLLLAPLIATMLALAFAIKYPYDYQGVVKGVYIQFGAPPLYAMFGIAVAWAGARRSRFPILGILLLGLGAVAVYAIRCRVGWI